MLLISARRDKTTIKVVYRLTDEVPYLPVYCALFCPYLHEDKATKRATAFGLIGAVFLWNTAKPLFFLNSFLFQCLTHTEKALKDFLPVTQSRHGAGRVIHTNLDYCQSLYISFIFAVLIIANFSVLRQIT